MKNPDVTGDEWGQPQWSIGTYGRSPGQRASQADTHAPCSFFVFVAVLGYNEIDISEEANSRK
ncbi:hypothetical protein Elgi_73150 [Paenibacillus elgii]|nr:hypothetical protein Elgi_73150 [Paenibacillus elgii]